MLEVKLCPYSRSAQQDLERQQPLPLASVNTDLCAGTSSSLFLNEPSIPVCETAKVLNVVITLFCHSLSFNGLLLYLYPSLNLNLALTGSILFFKYFISRNVQPPTKQALPWVTTHVRAYLAGMWSKHGSLQCVWRIGTAHKWCISIV